MQATQLHRWAGVEAVPKLEPLHGVRPGNSDDGQIESAVDLLSTSSPGLELSSVKRLSLGMFW